MNNYDEVEDIFGSDDSSNESVQPIEPIVTNESVVNNEETPIEEPVIPVEATENYAEPEVQAVGPVVEEVQYEEPVTPIEPTENYVEPEVQTVEQVNEVQTEQLDDNIDLNVDPTLNEHPDGKIVLNKNISDDEDEVKVSFTADDFKNINPKHNTSLKFVVIVGIIIFVMMMLFPLLGI